MQPYFFPYIGYFQLIKAVDEFVVYDQIEYTKKGWINRNRILVNGNASYITLSLKSGSDTLNVNERFLSDSWPSERRKLINRIAEAYRRAPQFNSAFEMIEKCLLFDNPNLFAFIYNSLVLTIEYLGISTKFTISSAVPYNKDLKGEDKVLSLLKGSGASGYINPIGGQMLYSKERFRDHGIDLMFLKAGEIEYSQQSPHFVPNLSIIDMIMFNPKEAVSGYLNTFELV